MPSVSCPQHEQQKNSLFAFVPHKVGLATRLKQSRLTAILHERASSFAHSDSFVDPNSSSMPASLDARAAKSDTSVGVLF